MKINIEILYFFTVLMLVLTLLGLHKPYRVLWWLSYKNRMMVLKTYGTVTVILIIILLLVWGNKPVVT